jgi:hypothetical protein
MDVIYDESVNADPHVSVDVGKGHVAPPYAKLQPVCIYPVGQYFDNNGNTLVT